MPVLATPRCSYHMNTFQEGLLRVVRGYSRLCPIRKGKWPLQQLALSIAGPGEFNATTPDGAKFVLSFPADHHLESIYFQGRFETGTSQLLKSLLRATDIVFDIGANIGWYTVLCARIATQGRCHAFEPSPAAFGRLKKNCELNGLNLRLNNVALADTEGTATLYSFKSLGLGFSSLSPLGRTDYSSATVRLTTLDGYVRENGIKKVDLIKMDVEGAEMSVLAGAEAVLRAEPAPIWLVEMNQHTAEKFGYRPEELLARLQSYRQHKMFRCPEDWGPAVPMKQISDYRQGDNVFCVPPSHFDRLAQLGF